MGQKRNVSVTNIIAQETIEHKMLSVLKFKSAVAAGILDNGEDSIFAGDDKFKQFMQSVEAITATESDTAPALFDEPEKDEISDSLVLEDGAIVLNQPIEEIFEETINQQPAEEEKYITEITEPQQLLQNGVNFLSQLMTTLNNPEATKNLAQSITEKDEKTGQTYLKIPIQNTDVVESVLSFLSKLSGKSYL